MAVIIMLVAAGSAVFESVLFTSHVMKLFSKCAKLISR